MLVRKGTAALLLVCLLALSVLPAAAGQGLTGVWRGRDAYGEMMLFLGENGCFITVYESNTVYKQAGVYTLDQGVLSFQGSGGTLSRLAYSLEGDSLIIQDQASGENMTMARLANAVPQALVGEWLGDTGESPMLLRMDEEGSFETLDLQTASEEDGIFLIYGETIIVAYADGSAMEMSYALDGDSLAFSDSTGANVALKRQKEAESPEATPLLQETITPNATAAPANIETAPLAGTWKESDATGRMQLQLSEDGAASLRRGGLGIAEKQGTYTADESTITIWYGDGTQEVFRYMLVGETMLLTDEALQNPVTLKREAAQAAPVTGDALDAAVVGTWGGVDQGVYLEATVNARGEVHLFFPADESRSYTAWAEATDGQFTVRKADEVILTGAYTLDEDSLALSAQDRTVTFHRKAGPLIRASQGQEEASSAADAALSGTWGGMNDGVYAEWTFHGNGTFEKLVLQDDSLSLQGTYMAGGGKLLLLTAQSSLQAAYATQGENVTLTFTDAQPAVFSRKTGPLAREFEQPE